jgi:hypothetical protein
MLQLFRNNSPVAAIILLIYAVLVRLHDFITPSDWQPTNPDYFSKIIYDWVGTSGFLPGLIALLLVFLQAFMLNQIITNNKMLQIPNYFVAVSYVLIASAIPEFLELHPLHFANTFFIIGLNQLFKSYRKYNAASELFNVGFSVAIGSLFYFSFNVLLLFAIMGLLVVRSFNLKEILIIFIGFFVPFFLIGTYLFWIDSFESFRNLWANFYFLDFNIVWEAATYAKLGLFIVLLVFSFLNFQSFYYRTTIQTQKYISMFYWAMFTALISLIYQGNVELGHLLILAPSLAVFLGLVLTKFKNKAVAEFLHLSLLIIVLILQYKVIF